MDYTWNLAAEVQYREYGLTDRYNFRFRNSTSFERNIGGSKYILKHMEPRNFCKFLSPACCDFNDKGNLICIGGDLTFINIFEWAQKKEICSFKTDEDLGTADIKFMKSTENHLDIIVADEFQSLWHTKICPTGTPISTCIFHEPDCVVRAAAVPGKSNEIVVVDSRGGICLIDLRSKLPQILHSPSNAFISHEQEYRGFTSVAHHPFASEICVGLDKDFFALIFDKRNLKENILEMTPNYEMFRAFEDHNETYGCNVKCNYNFDGSEVMVSSYPGSCVYRNQQTKFLIEKPAEFFGPKSEFIVTFDPTSIGFYDKNYEKLLERDLNGLANGFKSVNLLKCHPNLPLICFSFGFFPRESDYDFFILTTTPESV